MEMAALLHHLWFVRSRMGAWDHPSRGHRHFIDLHCRSNGNFRKIFLPAHLGWWAPRVSGGPKDETTFSDDAAYLCTKALADDIGFSLQGMSPEVLRTVPHYRSLAGIFRRFETARRSGLVSEGVRRELARAGAEFELDDNNPDRFRGMAIHRVNRTGKRAVRGPVLAVRAWGLQIAQARHRVRGVVGVSPVGEQRAGGRTGRGFAQRCEGSPACEKSSE